LQNLDPWINKNEPTNKFENHLLTIKAEHQKKEYDLIAILHIMNVIIIIIELTDWTLEEYKASIKKTQQQNEQIILDNYRVTGKKGK
jgi:hypothetical protein